MMRMMIVSIKLCPPVVLAELRTEAPVLFASVTLLADGHFAGCL
jgi:hypothetical protein